MTSIQVGAEPPTTWDELMALVPVFNDAGIAPISLGGQSRWTNMMWLEMLFDRIGGPELFESIYNGTPNWTDPSAIDTDDVADESLLDINPQAFVRGQLRRLRSPAPTLGMPLG